VADFGGRYRLIRRLGAGGMGEVWLAYDQELYDRPVAIKMMHSRMLADAEDVARFQREMRLASWMQHPNIMTVFTTGNNNGVPFMVMEYLEGQDLGKMLTGHRADEVARIGRDTCMALAYAHGLGVVHRDIKPGNLFICDTGLVKVTDFGIAKAVTGTKLSATGTLIGTFPYMAPEQWLGMPAAFSNDIWAVGCVLYELLSGRVPRSYATATEYVAAAARQETVPPLKAYDVPQWIITAVMAMLQPDPTKRPVVAQCLQLLSGPPAPTAPVQVPRVPPAQLISALHLRASQSAPASSRAIPDPGLRTSTGAVAARVAYPSLGQPPSVPPGAQTWQPPFQQVGPSANTMRRVRPGTVRAAYAVMLVGAALAALSAIAVLFDFGFAYWYTGPLLFRILGGGWSRFTSVSWPGFLCYLIECGLWLWIAQAVKAGRSWTRRVSTFLLGALVALVVAYHFSRVTVLEFAHHFTFVGGYAADYFTVGTLGGLLTILIGIAGCAVVVMLWLRPSGEYFGTTGRKYIY
jgi:serine/threonine protein kinase